MNRSNVVVAALALAAPACLFPSFFAHGGERAGYSEYVHELSKHDRDPDAGIQYTGRLPRHLERFTDDPPFRSLARSERRAAAFLMFAGIDGDQICFMRGWREDVFEFNDEQRARVERIAGSYSYALEVVESVDAPAYKGRRKWWPDTPVVLTAETVGMEEGTRDPGSDARTLNYLEVTQKICGAKPALTESTQLLTVVVKPAQGVELNEDPYPLFWFLTDDTGNAEL
jgi:hypothetical protein